MDETKRRGVRRHVAAILPALGAVVAGSRAIAISTCVLMALGAMPAHALPFGTTTGSCEASTNFPRPAGTTTLSPLDAPQFNCPTPHSSASYLADLRPPTAFVDASGLGAIRPGFGLQSSSAVASATVDFTYQINEKAPPPDFVGPLPHSLRVGLLIRTETTGRAVANAVARVSVSDFQNQEILERRLSHQAREGSDVELEIFFLDRLAVLPGLPHSVHKEASCVGQTAVGQFSCSALADPTFSFDQTAFDAMRAAQGLSSFRLDEFFEVTFSPNATVPPGPGPEPVAQPSSIALLLTGLYLVVRRQAPAG